MSDEERVGRLVEEASARLWPGTTLDSAVPMRGDASSRRYFRCRLSRTGDPTAPQSCIAMLMAGDVMALSSEELSVLGPEGPQELPFLNVMQFLSKLTDSIPRLYHCVSDQSALLLEDVGDVSLWQAANEAPANVESLFEAALDLLSDLQARAHDDGSGCYAFRQSFDARLYNWEFEHFIEYGVDGADLDTLETCKAELSGIAERLAGAGRVFCHRDFHAWNIHVREGQLRLLDFQDALLGNPFYDVASLLTDRITPQLVDSQMETRLLHRFALAAAPDHPSAGCDPVEMYVECALQRALKVIGRFNYLADVKNKHGYTDFLPAIGATAKKFCARTKNLGATGEILERYAKLGDADSTGVSS